MKRIVLYHFGDCGALDQYNPFTLYYKDLVPEILYIIANNKPFTIQVEDIASELNTSVKYIKKQLLDMTQLKMITNENNRYKLNFTVILEKDIETLKKFTNNIGEIIGDKIITQKNKIHKLLEPLKLNTTNERLLYHFMGDRVFDGDALEYFADREVFRISKVQPNNRDYILIGYEDSSKIEQFSSRLLCSSNNIKSNKYLFNSFGDCNGNRKDMFRHFRRLERALNTATEHTELNELSIKLFRKHQTMMLNRFGETLEHIVNNNSVDSYSLEMHFLKELNYLETINDKLYVKIPIINKEHLKIQRQISKYTLNLIEDDILHFFNSLEKNKINLTALDHCINIKEVANELWHLIFGAINEYLVEKGFFEKVKHIEGQGRFLQCVYID